MKSFYLKIPIRSLCTGSEQEAVDAPALEGLLRQSTWFRTPLGQAGLLSRRSVASAASWSLCRHWSEAARRSPGQPDPKSEAYTPERSSVERRRCGEREGAERRDADTLAARAASGKEAAEKARKASPVWEPCCIKKGLNLQVAPRGAWHQNSPIGEKRRIPRIPHQASPAACCGCSQQR